MMAMTDCMAFHRLAAEGDPMICAFCGEGGFLYWCHRLETWTCEQCHHQRTVASERTMEIKT